MLQYKLEEPKLELALNKGTMFPEISILLALIIPLKLGLLIGALLFSNSLRETGLLLESIKTKSLALIFPPLISIASPGFKVFMPILLFDESIHIKLLGSGV